MTKSNLSAISDADLQAEIERRKRQNSLPKPLETPNFSDLVSTIETGVAQMVKDQYEDEDFKHWIYEAAMKAVYGRAYFEWRCKQNF